MGEKREGEEDEPVLDEEGGALAAESFRHGSSSREGSDGVGGVAEEEDGEAVRQHQRRILKDRKVRTRSCGAHP